MDRTTGENYATVGGRRQFTDGPPGTTVTGAHMTAIQEEIMACIEGAGITPDANTLTQLRDAILATVSAGGFFGVPAIGLSVGGGGEGAWVSGGNSTMEGEHHFTNFHLQSAHQLSVGSTGILIIRCTGSCTINGSINGAGGIGGYGSTIESAAGGNGVGGGGAGCGGIGGGTGGGSGGGIWSAGGSATGSLWCSYPGSGKTNLLLIRQYTGIAGGSGANGSTMGGGTKGGNSLFVGTEWAVCFLLANGLFPLGGGGGGGGSAGIGASGGGGGGGGGFVLIVANQILGTGTASVNGGAGGATISGGGGGGGGGGGVILVSKNNPSNITISAAGGAGGIGSFVNGESGTNGFAKKYYPGV